MGTRGELEIGLALPQRGIFFGAVTREQMFDLTRLAESHPRFGSVWVGDSLYAKPRPEAITLLAGLAAATTRLKLGVGCMASFPVRDALVFAYQWATLDWLSAGRTWLCVCTGMDQPRSKEEASIWGATDAERPSRLEEGIDICRQLWAGEEVGFAGRFTHFENFISLPRPVQDPCPIWIATNPHDLRKADRPLRRVAAKADGLMTTATTPGLFGPLWKRMQELLVDAGRDPETFPNILYHNVNINDERDAAYDETKRFLRAYYGHDLPTPMATAWTAFGPPEECIRQIRALHADGAKAMTFRFTSWDQEGQFRRFVDEVLPHI